MKMWQTMITFLDCDLEINIPGTDLISPNHPSSYLGNLDCTNLIKFEEGERINLNFIEFDLETVFGDW